MIYTPLLRNSWRARGHHVPQKPNSRVIVGTERSLAHHSSRALVRLFRVGSSSLFAAGAALVKNKLLTRFTAKVKESEGARGGTRMYYDLNVPYSANHGEVQRTLAFLAERQSFSDPNPLLTDPDVCSGLQQCCLGSCHLRTSSGKCYEPNTVASTVQCPSIPPSPSTLHSTCFRPFPKPPPQQYQLSIRHCSTPTNY